MLIMPRLTVHCSAARHCKRLPLRKTGLSRLEVKWYRQKLHLVFMNFVPQLIQKSTGEGKSCSVEETLVDVFGEADLNTVGRGVRGAGAVQPAEGRKPPYWKCST